MITIAICDDDRSYLYDVEQFIYNWADTEELDVSVLTYSHGDALLAACNTHQIDIILLDIMMPLLNGMDVAREIRKSDTAVKIIFLTSSVEYAVDSYDVKASGYLLKPIRYEKLKQLLRDLRQELNAEPNHIVLKTKIGHQKIYYHHIECIEAQNKKVIFHLNNLQYIEVINSFSFFNEMLPLEKGFFQCHRSYIVYIPNIDQFNATKIVTKSGIIVPISRGYSKEFKNAYFTYMFRKDNQ